MQHTVANFLTGIKQGTTPLIRSTTAYLQSKRREQKEKPWLCRLFWHRWGKWTRPKELTFGRDTMLESTIRYQEKRCRDCGKIKERSL